LLVSLGFLIYASWRDYQVREVSDKVWMYYAPIAAALSVSELLLFAPIQIPFFGLTGVIANLIFFGISVGVTTVFAFLLFFTGAYGGADSKAFMCIAVALPFAPTAFFVPIFVNGLSPISQFLFPITIFMDTAIFAALFCVYLLFHNVFWHKKNGKPLFDGNLKQEPLWKKFLVIITGRKVNVAKLKGVWHLWPMEDLDVESGGIVNRKLFLIPHFDEETKRDQLVERLSNAVDAKKIDAYVWTTPGLPQLIFVTLGLITAVVFGDVIWMIVGLFLG
jgi:archaeal preflagellin peptidase FlaK